MPAARDSESSYEVAVDPVDAGHSRVRITGSGWTKDGGSWSGVRDWKLEMRLLWKLDPEQAERVERIAGASG